MSDDGRSSSPNSQSRYICHICNANILPNLPSFTCPTCGEGFIEEIQQVNVVDISDDEEPLTNADGHSHVEADMQGMTEHQQNIVQMFMRMYQPNSQTGHMMSGTMDNGARAHIRVNTHGSPINTQMLNGIFENIIGGLHGVNSANVHLGPLFDPSTSQPGIHSNVGDYAWGAGGIDNIITQLMNQMENSGVPPATDKDISKLENSNIQQREVDKQTQCSVCMEYFVIGEQVKKLKCTHMFHKDCIIPWLKIHSTCPVCRKGLDGLEPQENQSPDGPSASDPSSLPRHGEYQEEDYD